MKYLKQYFVNAGDDVVRYLGRTDAGAPLNGELAKTDLLAHAAAAGHDRFDVSDVLAVAGLDAEDPSDVARIAAEKAQAEADAAAEQGVDAPMEH